MSKKTKFLKCVLIPKINKNNKKKDADVNNKKWDVRKKGVKEERDSKCKDNNNNNKVFNNNQNLIIIFC